MGEFVGERNLGREVDLELDLKVFPNWSCPVAFYFLNQTCSAAAPNSSAAALALQKAWPTLALRRSNLALRRYHVSVLGLTQCRGALRQRLGA